MREFVLAGIDDDENFRIVEDSGDCGADAPHVDYRRAFCIINLFH